MMMSRTLFLSLLLFVVCLSSSISPEHQMILRNDAASIVSYIPVSYATMDCATGPYDTLEAWERILTGRKGDDHRRSFYHQVSKNDKDNSAEKLEKGHMQWTAPCRGFVSTDASINTHDTLLSQNLPPLHDVVEERPDLEALQNYINPTSNPTPAPLASLSELFQSSIDEVIPIEIPWKVQLRNSTYLFHNGLADTEPGFTKFLTLLRRAEAEPRRSGQDLSKPWRKLSEYHYGHGQMKEAWQVRLE